MSNTKNKNFKLIGGVGFGLALGLAFGLGFGASDSVEVVSPAAAPLARTASAATEQPEPKQAPAPVEPAGPSADQPQPMPVADHEEGHEGHDHEAGHCVTVLGLSEMTRYADRIVVGRVVKAEAKRGEGEDAALIFTHYTLRVEHPIKGTRAKIVKVKVLGGSLGDLTTSVSHMPSLAVGERGVLFTEDDPRLLTSILGGSQGFLRIEKGQVRDGFGNTVRGVDRDNFLVTDDSQGAIAPKKLVKKIHSLLST
jgi:hypothetical protein